MRILEEFWNSNIELTKHDASFCKAHKRLVTLICRNEKSAVTMTHEQKGLLEEHMDYV